MPVTPSNSIYYGWWSPSRYQLTGKCYVYSRPDGSWVAVTIASTRLTNPHGSKYSDAIMVGEIITWLGNPPPLTGSIPNISSPPTWPAGQPPDLTLPITSTNSNLPRSSIGKVPCDCPMSIVLRSGCQQPNNHH